jgi:DNA-binding NarL/FixJ family response regulator
VGHPILTRSVLATVETAYSLEGDDGAWLERVVRAASADLDRGFGLYAATGRITRMGHATLMPMPPFVAVDLDPACHRHALALHPKLPCPILDAFAPRALVVGGLDEAWPKRLAAAQLYRDRMKPAHVEDAFLLFAQDGEGGAVQIVAPSPVAVSTHPHAHAAWGRVALHIAAALRLRRRASAGQVPRAVLELDGTVVHAEGTLADDGDLRQRLTRAVKSVARARRAADPERALALWRALLSGGYSTVERWEADGRRFLLVYENEPHGTDPRALLAAEQRVAELVSLGASIKEAAYALGTSEGAAQKSLAQALRKLGLRTRAELAAFFTGACDAVPLRVGGADLQLLVADTAPSAAVLDGLTDAERDVAQAVLRGLGNAAIAGARGTSARTVANQLRRIFDKLGVRSRGELRARLTGSSAAEALHELP